MINSKGKGDKYERSVAKFLSSHFEEITGVSNSFQRNRSSGAYLGGKNKHRAEGMMDDQKLVGDIVTPSNFIYEIECKHYKSPPSYKQIITQSISQWDGWIEQAQSDVNTSGKHSFLLFIKYNLSPEIIIVDNDKFDMDLINPIYNYKNKYSVITPQLFEKTQKDKYFK